MGLCKNMAGAHTQLSVLGVSAFLSKKELRGPGFRFFSFLYPFSLLSLSTSLSLSISLSCLKKGWGGYTFFLIRNLEPGGEGGVFGVSLNMGRGGQMGLVCLSATAGTGFFFSSIFQGIGLGGWGWERWFLCFFLLPMGLEGEGREKLLG